MTFYLLYWLKVPSAKRSTLKGKNLLPREQILSSYSRPLFRRESNDFNSCLPWICSYSPYIISISFHTQRLTCYSILVPQYKSQTLSFIVILSITKTNNPRMWRDASDYSFICIRFPNGMYKIPGSTTKTQYNQNVLSLCIWQLMNKYLMMCTDRTQYLLL